VVKPWRELKQKAVYRKLWWQFTRPRPEMRKALRGLERYVACDAQGKRLLLVWADAWVCPSNLTFVFAFQDDYTMGVLSSSAHSAWAWSRSSTLKGDLRYTPSSVFETFPWPDPVSDKQREIIGDLSSKIIKRRQEICAVLNQGLPHVYNLVDDGAYADLRSLHTKLDEAVVAAYGWPKAAAHDDNDAVRRLLALSREISAGQRRYEPFGDQELALVELPYGAEESEEPEDSGDPDDPEEPAL